MNICWDIFFSNMMEICFSRFDRFVSQVDNHEFISLSDEFWKDYQRAVKCTQSIKEHEILQQRLKQENDQNWGYEVFIWNWWYAISGWNISCSKQHFFSIYFNLNLVLSTEWSSFYQRWLCLFELNYSHVLCFVHPDV